MKRVVCATEVVESLKELDIPFEIVNDNATFDQFMAMAGAAKDGLVLFTTRPSILRDYDQHHPERIVCILACTKMSSLINLVFVNNRQYSDNISHHVKTWYARAYPQVDQKSTCAVCADPLFKKPGKKRGGQKISICPCCCMPLCLGCFTKVNDEELPGHRCPFCRYWSIVGDDFGTPLEMLPPHALCVPQAIRASRLSVMADALAVLDGLVMAFVKVGNTFVNVSDPPFFVRLSGTKRVVQGSFNGMMFELQRIVDKAIERGVHGETIGVYVVRKTWQIAAAPEAEKPVLEHALFEAHRGGFICVHPDCHKSMSELGLRLFDNMTERKVELSPPAWSPPPLPGFLHATLERVAGLKCTKTVSVVFDDAPAGRTFNFDLDAENAVSSVPTPHLMRIAHIASIAASNALHIAVRIFCKKPAFVLFKAAQDSSSIVQLPSASAKQFFLERRDNLENPARVKLRFPEPDWLPLGQK